jgi:cysteine desulfurase
MKRIYLDHAASTPLDPRVLSSMRPYFVNEYGNPGSLHSFGQKAMGTVDAAREIVAGALGVDFKNIVFTGSATEASNLFLRSAVSIFRKEHGDIVPRIIISEIEHESILETAKDLEKNGAELVVLPVNKKGAVDMGALSDALTENAAVVSIMYVNNETGVAQPISKISALIKEKRGPSKYPLFHTDAAQAFQLFSCLPKDLGVDGMTISGHKIYGPKGIGALYSSLPLLPSLTGGGQEFGARSGTENVPAIAGFAKAVVLALEERGARLRSITGVRDKFVKELKKIAPRMQINGDGNGSPHILNVWLPGYSSEDLLIRLDLNGVAVSAGSACRSRTPQASYVLEAMGIKGKRALESIRVSFGVRSKEEIGDALKVFRKVLK